MRYTKCGLCLRNLEVIKPASGGPTCVVLSGKSVPSSVLKRLCTDISSVSTNALFLISTPVKEENNCFVKGQRYLPYKCQDSKETHTDLTSHAEEKKNVSTFNGQMNFLLLMKKKHLPTDQDPSYKDNNLVEQMAVDIRLYT